MGWGLHYIGQMQDESSLMRRTFNNVTGGRVRYPGKSTMEAIAMLPYEPFARWGLTGWKKRGEEYDAFKQKLAARLREEVERQVPSTAGHIAYTELSTPLTTRHFTNHDHGKIYGLSATPERYGVRALRAGTPVRGLYLTGQDVACLGIAGAMFGGVICASAALRRNLIPIVSKPLPASKHLLIHSLNS